MDKLKSSGKVTQVRELKTPNSFSKIRRKPYLIYRQMSISEALKTLEERKLQLPIKFANSEKWLTEDAERKFSNKGVKTGTVECIVAFELNPKYERYMKKNAIPQLDSGEMKDYIKYHQENLLNGGDLYNYAIPKNHLTRFNKNVIRVSIIKNLGPHEEK